MVRACMVCLSNTTVTPNKHRFNYMYMYTKQHSTPLVCFHTFAYMYSIRF